MVQDDNVVECSLWKGQPVTECLVVLLSAARYSMTVWLSVDGDSLWKGPPVTECLVVLLSAAQSADDWPFDCTGGCRKV